MKKIYMVLFILWTAPFLVFAQNTLPAVEVENLRGEKVLASDFKHDGPIVLNFWATWCKPCVQELGEIQDQYEDWIDETNVKVIAISIDDARSASKVNGFVNGKGWEFEVYLDKNSDLRRALNVNNVPYTILIGQDKQIIWKHAGYTPGDEDVLYEELIKISE